MGWTECHRGCLQGKNIKGIILFHLGWNKNHLDYNVLIDERAYQLDLLYKQNNWDQSRIQKEIRNLQSEIKKDLKKEN